MDMLRGLFTALLCVGSTGCAYFTTYTKAVDLESQSYSLDVKQRVVLSKRLETTHPESGVRKSIQVVCAEPSPDAMTVISASAGADAANSIAAAATRATDSQSEVGNASGSTSTNTNARQSLNVTAALAEQGAFVGLRTQSIQLLRDTMYRLCEGYASGAITEEEFTAMQRRYQSTMMGLLAIEQLTRPVVAAQVVLASSAQAKSGPLGDTSAIDAARTRLDAKEKELTAAQVAYGEAKAAEDQARDRLTENLSAEQSARSSAITSTDGDEAAKKAAADAAAKPFLDARPELQRLMKTAATNTSSRSTVLRASEKAQAQASDDLLAVKSATSSQAGGYGNMGPIREAAAQMTAELSRHIYLIVQEINSSYTRDGCFSLLQQSAKYPTSRNSAATVAALDVCSQILTDALTSIRKPVRSEGAIIPFGVVK